MSNLAVGMVLSRSLAKGSEKLLLAIIADGADDDGKFCWAGTPYLAWKAGLTERGGRYVLERLLKDGEVVVEVNAQLIIPDGSRGYVPDRFLHVRCCYDWQAYGAENFAALKARALARPVRQTLPDRAAKIAAHTGNRVPKQRKPASADLLDDLLGDLSRGTSAGATADGGPDRRGPAERRQSKPPRVREVPTQAQAEKLVHVMLDARESLAAPFKDLADLYDEAKWRFADAGFLCDPDMVTRVCSSVLVQRGFSPGLGFETRKDAR